MAPLCLRPIPARADVGGVMRGLNLGTRIGIAVVGIGTVALLAMS